MTATQHRERAVPCQRPGCDHRTWNTTALCDRCLADPCVHKMACVDDAGRVDCTCPLASDWHALQERIEAEAFEHDRDKEAAR